MSNSQTNMKHCRGGSNDQIIKHKIRISYRIFGNRYPFLGYSLDLDCLSPNSKTYYYYFDNSEIKNKFLWPRILMQVIQSFIMKILDRIPFFKHKSASPPQCENIRTKDPTLQQQLLRDIRSLSPWIIYEKFNPPAIRICFSQRFSDSILNTYCKGKLNENSVEVSITRCLQKT